MKKSNKITFETNRYKRFSWCYLCLFHAVKLQWRQINTKRIRIHRNTTTEHRHPEGIPTHRMYTGILDLIFISTSHSRCVFVYLVGTIDNVYKCVHSSIIRTLSSRFRHTAINNSNKTIHEKKRKWEREKKNNTHTLITTAIQWNKSQRNKKHNTNF